MCLISSSTTNVHHQGSLWGIYRAGQSLTAGQTCEINAPKSLAEGKLSSNNIVLNLPEGN